MVLLEPDHLQQLGVYLEINGSVDHMHADLLQFPGDGDVVNLVELCPELHEHRYGLAVLLGPHQLPDDLGVLAYPVEAYLD